eukprot:Platyproteum_vivax@DN7389_c1_g6_i2.p1
MNQKIGMLFVFFSLINLVTALRISSLSRYHLKSQGKTDPENKKDGKSDKEESEEARKLRESEEARKLRESEEARKLVIRQAMEKIENLQMKLQKRTKDAASEAEKNIEKLQKKANELHIEIQRERSYIEIKKSSTKEGSINASLKQNEDLLA